MKVKTSEMQGPTLGWAVALIEHPEWKEQGFLEVFPHDLSFEDGASHITYTPPTDWAQGGPIIEREKITLEHLYGAGDTGADVWVAMLTCEDKKFGGVECFEEQGPTALVAAMRCYVASKLGDEVEIPEELK
jgi:hypothetical protein